MIRGLSYRSVASLIAWALIVVALHAQHAALTGATVDVTGAAIPSASVRLLLDGKTLYSESTIGDGTFRFPDVVPGTFTLYITHEAFMQSTQHLTLDAGERKSLKPITLGLANIGPVVRMWPEFLPVHLEETPATSLITTTVTGTKPCPARVRVANDGVFYFDHGVWFRQSPAKVQLFIENGCYPEDGPSPTSSVTIELAPRAPEARVKFLYEILAKAGWPKERVTIARWMPKPR